MTAAPPVSIPGAVRPGGRSRHGEEAAGKGTGRALRRDPDAGLPLGDGKKPLERRAIAWACALVLEKLEGKPAGREVLDLLAAKKRPPRRVRFAVKAAG